MTRARPGRSRRLALLGGIVAATAFLGAGLHVFAACAGYDLPFTDLGSESTFCAAIAEAYFSGLTNGTSATTYSPSSKVPRDQMAAFITRTLDQSLLRGSRRAALDQWWTPTPHFENGLAMTSVGTGPSRLACDGADVWVTNSQDNSVTRVRASDGKNLETWTNMSNGFGIMTAMNRVFVIGFTGSLYEIDPSQAAGPALGVATMVLQEDSGIA
ncbi:MAG TPA: S-layer homology domain-containing protein, partial [Thermoanaerobaculia bacterium]|nr:S-layer homology domain-containing protein [Thermoanaerobaculia bacterium]